MIIVSVHITGEKLDEPQTISIKFYFVRIRVSPNLLFQESFARQHRSAYHLFFHFAGTV